MTTIRATAPDRCGRCAVRMQANDLFCGACGAARIDDALTAPIPLPRHVETPRVQAAPPPEVTEMRRPVVVLVAQVMVGVSIVVDIVWVAFGSMALLAVGSVLARSDGSGYSGGATAPSWPWSSA